MPCSTGEECAHEAAELGLAVACEALVHTFAEPDIGVRIPRIQQLLPVVGELQFGHVHVLAPCPLGLVGDGVDAIVCQARQDTSSVGERPNAIVLETCHKTTYLDKYPPLP
jgi:hypothetical protein